jgi:hypothetical protein
LSDKKLHHSGFHQTPCIITLFYWDPNEFILIILMHNKMNFLAHWQTKLYTLFDIDSQKKGGGG